MGLDQYAGWLIPIEETKSETNVVNMSDYRDEEPCVDSMDVVFEWRKHARLQEHMRQLWYQRRELKAPYGMLKDEFNGEYEKILLDYDDINLLLKRIKEGTLPFCSDGFYWGQDFQEESMKDYKEQDIEFCKQAFKWLEEGKKVWYECSW